VIELIGSYLLTFFGISIPIVQLGGGLVVASMGWSVLNQPDNNTSKESKGTQTANENISTSWADKTFYPLMFPMTAGPGCLVVMLTLSAHATGMTLAENLLARAGLMIAVLGLAILVYLCYAYAPQITQKIAPSTAHGILQVIAFILFCIGVQIAWNGLDALLKPLIGHRA
jgi:multiple antibiotic resistance protein